MTSNNQPVQSPPQQPYGPLIGRSNIIEQPRRISYSTTSRSRPVASHLAAVSILGNTELDAQGGALATAPSLFSSPLSPSRVDGAPRGVSGAAAPALHVGGGFARLEGGVKGDSEVPGLVVDPNRGPRSPLTNLYGTVGSGAPGSSKRGRGAVGPLRSPESDATTAQHRWTAPRPNFAVKRDSGSAWPGSPRSRFRCYRSRVSPRCRSRQAHLSPSPLGPLRV